jgi:hypothetical protein
LKLLPRGTNNAGANFPSYLDGYSNKNNIFSPYVYFSSGPRPNGYSGLPNTLGVSAYLQTANPLAYQNSTTFQIISSGANGQFGPGGIVWPPALIGAGADDMTNFTDVKLGSAP